MRFIHPVDIIAFTYCIWNIKGTNTITSIPLLICVHADVLTCVCVCVYVCACMHAYIYVYLYVYVRMCMYVLKNHDYI